MTMLAEYVLSISSSAACATFSYIWDWLFIGIISLLIFLMQWVNNEVLSRNLLIMRVIKSSIG